MYPYQIVSGLTRYSLGTAPMRYKEGKLKKKPSEKPDSEIKFLTSQSKRTAQHEHRFKWQLR